MPATPLEIAVALLLAIFGAIVQGSVGFGLAVVAAPVLLLVNPRFVPGPLLLAALVLTLLIALRDRRGVIRRDVALGTVGRIIGTLPAAYALSVLPAHASDLLFGVLVLAGVALSVSGWHFPPTGRNLVAAASLSGFTGTVSSVGGPPMALIYQHEKGPRIRGTMSAIFTIGTVISLIGLWAAGRFAREELLLGLLLVPAVLVGFQLSRYTAHRIDQAHTRPTVLAFSAISAVTILIRALMGFAQTG